MRSLKILLALSAGLLPTQAFAQAFAQQNPTGQIGVYNPPRTNPWPTYSPYNNLTRPGGAAANYFGTIRPQLDATRSFQQIQQNQTASAGFGSEPFYPGGVAGPESANPIQTGHAVAYFNTTHYFPPSGVRAGGGGSGVGGLPQGIGGANPPYFAGTNRPATVNLP